MTVAEAKAALWAMQAQGHADLAASHERFARKHEWCGMTRLAERERERAQREQRARQNALAVEAMWRAVNELGGAA